MTAQEVLKKADKDAKLGKRAKEVAEQKPSENDISVGKEVNVKSEAKPL